VIDELPIKGNELWVKVVAMLQQNWAAIEPAGKGVRVYFINDGSQVFDQMEFGSTIEAEDALARNGYRRFVLVPDAQRFLRAPGPSFTWGSHPNGPIYSSGRFWH